jgi:hypothetical protein
MVSPKDAQRRKQLQARERKHAKAHKQRLKKLERKAPSFEGVLARWMNLDPSELPLRETCPGCDLDIGVDADGGELVHTHEYPHCAAYAAFSRASDKAWDAIDRERGLEPGISMDDVMSRMVPSWTTGPCTEITEEEGDKLLESGQVLQSSMLMGGGMIGMAESVMYARTANGLFSWRVADDDFDDDDDLEDEDDGEPSGPPAMASRLED